MERGNANEWNERVGIKETLKDVKTIAKSIRLMNDNYIYIYRGSTYHTMQ